MTAAVTFRRAASLAPSSVNESARTVRVTVSTGAEAPRADLQGPYLERLDLNAIDPQALVGLPVVDTHQLKSIDNLLGTVVSAGRDARGLWADIKVSERAEGVWSDIVGGIIRGISIGYTVKAWAVSASPEGGRIKTAADWAIHEVSFVPLPVDAGATVRGNTMTTVTAAAAPTASPEGAFKPCADCAAPDICTRAGACFSAAAKVDKQAAPQTATGRASEIVTIIRAAGLDFATADRLIGEGTTMDQARSIALEAMQARQAPMVSAVHVIRDHNDPEAVTRSMSEALAAQLGGGVPQGQAIAYMTRSVSEMARELLTHRGVNGSRSLSGDALFRAAMHTTSDFPNLLTATGDRLLQQAFAAAPSPLKALARQRNAKDFRPLTSLMLGEAPQLDEIKESGEVTYGTRAEAKESFSVKTFAKMFSISRTALVNDDLSAFGDWAAAMGKAAAEREAAELVALLTANSGSGANTDDGKALFHIDHANKAGSGSAIDITSISAARLAMRQQKGIDGVTPIGVTPRYLLVGPEKETEAEQIVAALYPATTSDANPFQSKIEVVVEPRITGKSWRLFSDPVAAQVLQYAYLNGAAGPQIQSNPGWETLGMEMRVVLDFGCGFAVGAWRGCYMNPGA